MKIKNTRHFIIAYSKYLEYTIIPYYGNNLSGFFRPKEAKVSEIGSKTIKQVLFLYFSVK